MFQLQAVLMAHLQTTQATHALLVLSVVLPALHLQTALDVLQFTFSLTLLVSLTVQIILIKVVTTVFFVQDVLPVQEALQTVQVVVHLCFYLVMHVSVIVQEANFQME